MLPFDYGGKRRRDAGATRLRKDFIARIKCSASVDGEAVEQARAAGADQIVLAAASAGVG
jgi:coenzyme F420-reducing hydrogenase delta subunit